MNAFQWLRNRRLRNAAERKVVLTERIRVLASTFKNCDGIPPFYVDEWMQAHEELALLNARFPQEAA